MQLKDLKKQIPYHWKVQTISKFKPQATCVAYIDARDAMEILDEVVGPESWQDRYEFVGTKLIAGVGIKCGDEWVWKYDTGTEAQTEAEKSQFSDAFKRACVKWGIGRFLYDLDFKYVPTNEKNLGNNHPYPIDEQGQRIWDLTEYFERSPVRKVVVAPKASDDEKLAAFDRDYEPGQVTTPVTAKVASAAQMFRLKNEAAYLKISLSGLLAKKGLKEETLTAKQAYELISELSNTPR